jgi:hypothetical protein
MVFCLEVYPETIFILDGATLKYSAKALTMA